MLEGGILKRLMYAIPLSAIAVLVFAAIAVAQDVQKGQAQGQEPSQNATDTNTTDVQGSTTLPAKKNPAETTTPAQSTAPASNTTATVDIDINDQAFNPSQVNIAPGTTVRFFNIDTKPHTATADNNLFDTKELKEGEASEVYFEGSGLVTYHDELNPNMKGSIVVGEGVEKEAAAPQGEDPASQKGTAEEAPNEPSILAGKPASEAAKILATEANKPLRGF